MEGIVQRIVRDKGFGFIKGSDKVEYFFHRSALQNMQFDDLKEGLRVEYEGEETSRGFRAEDIYVQ